MELGMTFICSSGLCGTECNTRKPKSNLDWILCGIQPSRIHPAGFGGKTQHANHFPMLTLFQPFQVSYKIVCAEAFVITFPRNGTYVAQVRLTNYSRKPEFN